MIENLDKIKDKLWRLQHFYKIKDKGKRIVPFRFNSIQKTICDATQRQRPIRDITIKARQQGVSTFWLLWWLDDTIFIPNTTTAVLAHKWESLKSLMSIIKTGYETMPKEFKPRLGSDSAYELAFKDINSKIFVSLSIRSATINNLHVSEWCLCDDEEVRASLGAVPTDGNISGESTGNGVGNDGYFTYTEAKQGLNRFCPHFFPWFLDKTYFLPVDSEMRIEYTPEEKKFAHMAAHDYGVTIAPGQILWRRNKKQEQKDNFGREFPETEDDAFASGVDRYFDSKKMYALLQEAREFERGQGYYEKGDDYICFEKPEKYDLYVAGADTSEGSHDYSVLKVINVTKRREAFVYRARCGVDTFYKVCNEWGRKFGNCLLAIERNNHGHSVILGLDETCKYPNLYKEDNPRLGLKSGKLGFKTDKSSKPMMLDELKFALEGESTEDVDHFKTEITFLDQTLLREVLSFVKNGVRLEAEQGKYDDDIIATAIAMQMYKLMKKYTVKREASFGIIGKEDREAR